MAIENSWTDKQVGILLFKYLIIQFHVQIIWLCNNLLYFMARLYYGNLFFSLFGK